MDTLLFYRDYVKLESKCDVILVTLQRVETFNNYIVQARSKHLIDMLEDIRTLFMKKIALEKEEALKKCKSLLCPRVQALIEKEIEKKSKKIAVMPSTSILFQVSHYIVVLGVISKRKLELVRNFFKGNPMLSCSCVHQLLVYGCRVLC